MLTMGKRTTAPKNDTISERISKLPPVIGAPPINGVMMKSAKKALLSICAHYDASQPAQNAANDQ
jgi:hypothetical protein